MREIEVSGMDDHIWREKGGDHCRLSVEVEIIDRKHHWKIQKLKGIIAYAQPQKSKLAKHKNEYNMRTSNTQS